MNMNIATPSARTHGITNVVSRGRFSSMSSGGSRPSVAPRPPKLLVPKREGRRRLLQLPKSLFSSPDDSTKLHSGPAVVAELERKLAESGDQHVFQRHAYVSALATIDSLDATLTMPYPDPHAGDAPALHGALARAARFAGRAPPAELARRGLRAPAGPRRDASGPPGPDARHVLEIAAVAPAAPAPRQSSVGAGVPWAEDEPELVEDADGGGRRLLELIKRRLSSEHELSAVRLVASIDVALMVDGDDVRAENERLRAAAEDAHADAEDARGSVLCGNLHRVDGV